MNTTTILTYEALARVKDFGAGRTTDFPATGRGGQLFAEVAAVVAELSHQGTVQAASTGEALVSGAAKARLRVSLREDLRVFCRTAQVITANNPDLKKKFRLPKGGDQRLLSATRAFLENVEPIAAEFPKHDIPAEDLVKFKNDIDSFAEAISERNRNTESRVQSTARLQALLSDGTAAMHKLDVIVRNKYRNDKPSLAAWESARRIEHNGGRSRDQQTTDQGKGESPTHTTPGAPTAR